MQILFNAGTPDLQSFFCATRGFYVPLYQRPFSWDEDNARTLINDLINSLDKELNYNSNSNLYYQLFLGNVILYEEKNKIIGNIPVCHYDTHNLISKIDVVVDGQQRISVIGLIGTVLYQIIDDNLENINHISSLPQEITFLKTELTNIKNLIICLYSIDLRRISNVSPSLKPKIIRAENDFWSLNAVNTYKSDFALYFDEVIRGINPKNTSVLNNVPIMKNIYDIFEERINDKINSLLESTDFITNLLNRSSLQISPIYNIIDPNLLNNFRSFNSSYPNLQDIFIKSTYLLALSKFLLNGTFFGEMECKSEDISLDVFQSLNATGTPLTAFEVYKPKIISHFRSKYTTPIPIYKTTIQSLVKDIEDTIDRCKGKGKSNITDRIVTTTAMVMEGKEIPQKFSDERDWLFDFHTKQLINDPPTPQNIEVLVKTLAYQADYYENIIYPNKPKGSNFSILNFFNNMISNINIKIHNITITFDANMVALCLYFLRDANHNMAHYILSLFYSKILDELNKSTLDPVNIRKTLDELNCVCKAITAFYVLWAGGGVSGFPDNEYRKLFKNPTNISILNGMTNQTCDFIKQELRNILQNENIYDASSSSNAKRLWVNASKNTAWYSRSKPVTRFALFAAFHDASPDINPGKEGLMINGMPGSYPMLSCAKWYSPDFECIEHIATRDKPSTVKYSAHFDPNIYPGNFSVVDKIGNLTLLSRPVNSSIYSEWPDKVFYYWSLTTPSATSSGPSALELQRTLGLTSLPPSLSQLSAASSYQAHLAPLVLRGIAGLKWDKEFIDKRSEHLCERIFDKLDPWLR